MDADLKAACEALCIYVESRQSEIPFTVTAKARALAARLAAPEREALDFDGLRAVIEEAHRKVTAYWAPELASRPRIPAVSPPHIEKMLNAITDAVLALLAARERARKEEHNG